MGEIGEMNINLVHLSNLQTLDKPGKLSQPVPFKMKPLCKDQVCFAGKLPSNEEKSFIGLFGPPKVNKKILKELVSIMMNDPIFEKPMIARTFFSDFPVVELRKEGNELKFKMGFENSRGFYHKVNATVNVDSAKLSFESVDGLEYKESKIKYAIDDLMWHVIDYYKERM